MTSPMPAGQSRPRLAVAGGEAAILDGQWASDHWDASRLGTPARRGRGAARFDGIGQQWLRGPVKRWSRLRLATGCAFTTINAGALALTRFSRFLTARQLDASDASHHAAGPGGLPVLAAHSGIPGFHPGAVPVDDPGVL